MEEEAPYVAVFDVETKSKISDMPGRFREDKIKLLEISCASIVTIPSELCLDPSDRERAMEVSKTTTYWCDGEGANSMDAMCAALKGAELVVGYNVCGFDWLSAKKYFKNPDDFRACCEKTLDVFSRIRDATGVWSKLDRLLEMNGLETKTADGLIAIQWWADGERTLLKQYCERDTQQCARLALLPELSLGAGRMLSNYNFGVASALAALRASGEVSGRR
jgi:hypothetical protein